MKCNKIKKCCVYGADSKEFPKINFYNLEEGIDVLIAIGCDNCKNYNELKHN